MYSNGGLATNLCRICDQPDIRSLSAPRKLGCLYLAKTWVNWSLMLGPPSWLNMLGSATAIGFSPTDTEAIRFACSTLSTPFPHISRYMIIAPLGYGTSLPRSSRPELTAPQTAAKGLR